MKYNANKYSNVWEGSVYHLQLCRNCVHSMNFKPVIQQIRPEICEECINSTKDGRGLKRKLFKRPPIPFEELVDETV